MVASPIASHIEMAIDQGKTVIDDTLLRISTENLQKLQTQVSANSNEQSRTDYLARFVFRTGLCENRQHECGNEVARVRDSEHRNADVLRDLHEHQRPVIEGYVQGEDDEGNTCVFFV